LCKKFKSEVEDIKNNQEIVLCEPLKGRSKHSVKIIQEVPKGFAAIQQGIG
jgi:hypothetical protein